MEWRDVIAAVESTVGDPYLATASRSGRPHIAVVDPAIVGDGLLIATGRSSVKGRNMLQNPSVALHWPVTDQLMHVLVRGEAVRLPAVELEAVFSNNPFRWSLDEYFGGPDDPEALVIRVVPTSAYIQRGYVPPGERWVRTSGAEETSLG